MFNDLIFDHLFSWAGMQIFLGKGANFSREGVRNPLKNHSVSFTTFAEVEYSEMWYTTMVRRNIPECGTLDRGIKVEFTGLPECGIFDHS